MVEFGITVVLVALLITAIFLFKKRKTTSSTHTSSEPAKYAPKEPLKKEAKYPPQQEQQPLAAKPADKNAVNVEAAAVVNAQVTDAKAPSSPAPEPASNIVNSQITDAKAVSSQKPEAVSASASKVETPAKPQVQEVASTLKTGGFPEDSVLKRHYFYHLCTMVEELAPQHPTDSVLYRHHYTMLASRIEQCLHDKKALEQLTYDYEHRSA
jgi:hypothetical protein